MKDFEVLLGGKATEKVISVNFHTSASSISSYICTFKNTKRLLGNYYFLLEETSTKLKLTEDDSLLDYCGEISQWEKRFISDIFVRFLGKGNCIAFPSPCSLMSLENSSLVVDGPARIL